MKYFGLLFIIFKLHAAEVSVDSLSDGACWYDNKSSGGLQLSSFNDHQSLKMTFEEMNSNIQKLIGTEINEIQSIHLHCGALGASIIARIKSDSGNLCLWAMLDKGKLKVRSLGSTPEYKKGDPKLCDGYKSGELLVVLKNREFVDQLKEEGWSSIIKEIVPVAFNIYKVKLTSDYYFREEEVAKLFQDSFKASTELNFFQHGIGEYVQLK